MTTRQFIAQLGQRGIKLWIEGEALRFTARPGALTDELRREIVARKPEVLEFLRQSSEAARPSSPLRRVSRGEDLPVSFAQQRLWFLDRYEPGSALYNIPAAQRLRGALAVGALGRSVAEVVRRQESLRTVFRGGAGEEPVQVILAAPRGSVLPVVDLGGLGAQGREAELDRLVREDARRPFDLASGPLFRATLVRSGGEEHALLLCMHHIVSDGWSLGVLFRELGALYGAYLRGEASPLRDLEVQYADYAAWQREHLRGEALESQLAYWKDRLAGAPGVLELPTDRARPAVQSYRGAVRTGVYGPELGAGLQGLARGEGATLYMVLLAGFQVLLSRYAGQEEVVVGTPIAGRTRAEVEEVIGFFVNTLALRGDLRGDPEFRGLVGRVREATLGAYAHQDLPFEKLVEELRPERSLSHSPVFQVMFALQNNTGADLELSLEGLEATMLVGELGVAKFDLTLSVAEGAEGLRLWLEYSADLFDSSTAERMLEHYRVLLKGILADPARRISDLPLMDEAEVARVVGGWSGSGLSVGPYLPVHEEFTAVAARTPDAVALVFGDETVTYAELDRRADALAGHLRGLGVEPDARVGICVERSPAMVVGILGILKAGGAYVPLDPQHPDERLSFMLGDSGARVLLTEAGLAERFAGFGGEVVLVNGGTEYEVRNTERQAFDPSPPSPYSVPGTPFSPEHLFYVIYTSGSTGVPKGTEVPHRAVPGFFRGNGALRYEAGEVLLQHSSVSWDALTLELWPALLGGGTCVLLPGRAAEPRELGEQIRRHGVTTLWLTSAYFNLVMDTAPETLAGVRQLLVGGDVLSAPHARRALELYPDLRLVNGYGPSETTVFAACWPVAPGSDGAAVPIGRPVGDRRVYVADQHLSPVPTGVPGELYIGGPGVARGYLRRAALTAEKFVPDPFSGEAGARLYRSGDRVRWRVDGLLEFLGRVDFQVKVRGFRVEPGEIEAVLLQHPGVSDCVVVMREGSGGDAFLAAYVVAPGVAPVALADFLGTRLPQYMVPARFVGIDEMPRTPNGKVDRRALPFPDDGGAEREAAYVEPRSETEKLLAAIWGEVLGRPRVGIHEGFFALGGHSLLVARVVSRVRTAFQVELPLRVVFDTPTVAGMAEVIDRERGGRAEQPEVPIRRVDRATQTLALDHLSDAQVDALLAQLIPEGEVSP